MKHLLISAFLVLAVAPDIEGKELSRFRGTAFFFGGYHRAQAAVMSPTEEFRINQIGKAFWGIGAEVLFTSRVSAGIRFGRAQYRSSFVSSSGSFRHVTELNINQYSMPVLMRWYVYRPEQTTIFVETGPSFNWINFADRSILVSRNRVNLKSGGTIDVGARLPIDVSNRIFVLQAIAGYSYVAKQLFVNVSGFHILFGIGYSWGI